MFNLKLALAFASKGFHVFPLYKNNNPTLDRPWVEPKGWNRFRDGLPGDGRVELEKDEVCATVDPAQIKSWADKPFVVGYGLCAPFHIVLDLDEKNGKHGVKLFDSLKEEFGVPAPTIVVKTKSGGLHLYFDRERDFIAAKVNKATDLKIAGKVHPGIDLIANSGYVVGPYDEGPIEDWAEGQYLLVRGHPEHTELLPCPIQVYRGQIKAGVESRVKSKPTTADELITNAWQPEEESLDSIIRTANIPDKIPPGKRDSLVTSLIGVMKARRMPKAIARLVCEKFLSNCELLPGETREQFEAAIALDNKLNRLYASAGDSNDPRVVAREIVELGKAFKLVNQLPGAVAILCMEENPYLMKGVTYTETKARQDLAPFARMIPEAESKRPVNPFDLLIKDGSMPRVSSTGYKPVPHLTFVDPSDGSERVNLYVPPTVPLLCTKRSNIVQQYTELVEVVCGDMADYFLDFMAHIVQKPWAKAGTALLIISQTHGSGKNTIVQVMKPLIGPKNYLPLSGLQPLMEDKSIVLEGNVLIVFNEVHRPSNKNAWTDMSKAINKLKTCITEPSTQINPKYEKQRTITTFSNMVLLSNDNNPFDIETGDRRIAVINNDPPKLDQAKYSLVADFAHNEKNGHLTPVEYDDLTFELNEFFRSRIIANNVTTGDAPMSVGKAFMVGEMETPIAKALRTYRLERAPGATTELTCEDLVIYILKTVLGYKEFGRGKERYDVWAQFINSGVIRQVHWANNQKRTKVVTGLPSLRDREDYPLMGPAAPTETPQRIFVWGDIDKSFDELPTNVLRDFVWPNVDGLKSAKGRGDLLSMVKSS